jgi:hypothetical protein
VAPRSRIFAFGSCAALVVAGVACAVLVGGLAGEVFTIVLIAIGLGGAVLLVFLEIGLGEEHDRAREERQRRQRPTSEQRLGGARRPLRRHWPRRPGPD